MNLSGSILKTTAAVVGMSALGALGSGPAFAATPTASGAASSSHGISTVDKADLSSPSAASNGDQLHSFAMPKTATPAASPTTRYDDNNYNDRGYNDNSGYSRSGDSRYDDNNSNDNNYDNNYDNSDDNGYYDNGDRRYRNNDNGLLGGGLLGGNN